MTEPTPQKQSHFVIDNLLPENEWQKIHDYCTYELKYQTLERTTTEHEKIELGDVLLCKGIYSSRVNEPELEDAFDSCDSEEIKIFRPLMRELQMGWLLRMKVNVTPYTGGRYRSNYHVDYTTGNAGATLGYSCVYYLNTCSGGTEFEESGKFVQSIANRAVVFPSYLRHTGISQDDTKYRYVINMNYLTQGVTLD